MAKFSAKKGFTYKGKDYFKGDSIEVANDDVANLTFLKRIEAKEVKATENKAIGVKKSASSKIKKFFKK